MNGIVRIPFLSICIPTYNRAEHVFLLVNEILNCQSEEIEVVVLDNCSTDNTKDILSNIVDYRLIFKQNEKNIGGILNSVKVLTVANGEYALLCLDRDYIENQHIPSLIDSLQKDKDVVLGYCSLDLSENVHDMLYDKGFDSVMNMAYLSKHPSGDFYNTDVLKKLKILKDINNNYADFSFCHELINAEASFLGRSKRINIPVISVSYLNSKEDFALNKTLSYSVNNSNYYFKPSQRIVEYSTYMIHASTSNLSSKEKRFLFNKIYFRGLISSTYAFKMTLMDSRICSHYRIETRKVSITELLKYDFYYSISFMKLHIPLSCFRKIHICLFAHYKLFNLLFKRIVKNSII